LEVKRGSVWFAVDNLNHGTDEDIGESTTHAQVGKYSFEAVDADSLPIPWPEIVNIWNCLRDEILAEEREKTHKNPWFAKAFKPGQGPLYLSSPRIYK
jgi:hypothetical protein